MSDTVKTMLIGLAIVTALSYLVMGIGPRACAKNITESDDAIAEFAQRACAAVAAGSADEFASLLVTDGDQSVDEKYGWLPYPGADKDSFDGWHTIARAAFNEVVAARPADMKCGDIVRIDRGGAALDRQQGRINTITMGVTGAGGERVLELGSSVRTLRGRAFQGLADAVFVRWLPAAP